MTKPYLTALHIKNINTIGTYAVGKPTGLSLRVRPSNTTNANPNHVLKQWVLRYMIGGKARMMGLGSYPDISLEHARKIAQQIKTDQIILQRIDPLAHKAEAIDKLRQQRDRIAQRKTFDDCAKIYIATHRPSWKNEKHASQWVNTIKQYASPFIGAVPIDELTKSQILSVLRPIWESKNETATRLRGRIAAVLDWAKAEGIRQGDNPAAWEGGLKGLLPELTKKRRVKHHPALPYPEIGKFMKALKTQTGMSALALEFLILTCCRTNEVLGATWEEIDSNKAQWIIPAERMKAGKEHRIPLSTHALELLKKIGPSKGFIFKSPKDAALSNMALLALLKRMDRLDITTHGFRSTFRDWAGECTNFSREVIEHALAHGLKDKAEAAYARGTLMQKRAVLMQAWSDRCYSDDNADCIPQ